MNRRPTVNCHVVAIPYPGRGHINPMMNLCKLISLRRPSDFLITFIVTEEWLGFIGSDHKPSNIRFATVPNVIPSELNRAADFPGFVRALTKLEGPVEELLDRMEIPATVLIYDICLKWVVGLGNRKHIPVASLVTMSATVFSLSHHYDLLVQNGHAGDDMSEKGEELVDYIPGVPPTRVADLLTGFDGKGREIIPWALESVSMVSKAQFLLFCSAYELEAQVIDALKLEYSIPIYSIGPAIPYFNFEPNSDSLYNDQNAPDYVKWLDNQPKASVLYISQGSFLSVSSHQLDEIIAGVHDSGVRYLWIARGEASRFKGENGGRGLVVSWCDQLRVLSHSSVGAFWSHCGWNSTKEGAYSGVPMLTLPIFFDQVPNSKMIVEDWKIGMRVMKGEGILVTRGEIANLIKSFMDLENDNGKELRKRAKEIKEIFRQSIAKEGSVETDINSFISDILKVCTTIY